MTTIEFIGFEQTIPITVLEIPIYNGTTADLAKKIVGALLKRGETLPAKIKKVEMATMSDGSRRYRLTAFDGTQTEFSSVAKTSGETLPVPTGTRKTEQTAPNLQWIDVSADDMKNVLSSLAQLGKTVPVGVVKIQVAYGADNAIYYLFKLQNGGTSSLTISPEEVNMYLQKFKEANQEPIVSVVTSQSWYGKQSTGVKVALWTGGIVGGTLILRRILR